MRKILVLFLLLLSSILYAQPKSKQLYNTVYATIQPTDLGYGLRYDRKIGNHYAYCSFSINGNYKLVNDSYINDHHKFSLGGMFTLPFFYPDVAISAGISYHLYGENYFFAGMPPDKYVLTPISGDIGVATRLGRFSVAVRMDIIKWESSIDLGINF